jgi:hypothetical protein
VGLLHPMSCCHLLGLLPVSLCPPNQYHSSNTTLPACSGLCVNIAEPTKGTCSLALINSDLAPPMVRHVRPSASMVNLRCWNASGPAENLAASSVSANCCRSQDSQHSHHAVEQASLYFCDHLGCWRWSWCRRCMIAAAGGQCWCSSGDTDSLSSCADIWYLMHTARIACLHGQKQ